MPDTDIYELIECMTALIRSEERKKCTELNLQPVHFQALNYLARANKYSNTPAAVANYLGVTRGTVSQSLIVLEKKGLIEKKQGTSDKRVVHLYLLPEGRRLLQQARPSNLFETATAILHTHDQPPSPSDANVFQQALTALQKANQSQSFGVCKTCRNFSEKDGEFFCLLTQEKLSASDSEQICQEHIPI
ncbi:MAG: winged helix-turn-helix transcriptional regulator [Methylomonas sp.]|nr:winged helix-turn-helix transcriptional regulator [Methylomonas sp.]PPD21669.1 MAG: MarR family transcriptional regulator [Methylomonas sp.]PPD25950.1 MAG: MarR family transcriptional regulator [Methylomonas sp.]PPD37686.1 MAG: MarR family transcriptional regulator [Methylomonas sp.]PPD39293.1 MAG: MarR family transcriptional regulator [Methylomonas sp.]